MPPPPGRMRSIEVRNRKAQDVVSSGLDRPKKVRKKLDPNAWKKKHVTKKCVPKTRVAKY